MADGKISDHARKDRARKWQEETFLQASDLDPEHQALLKQMEENARNSMKDDPAIEDVYRILGRQLYINEEAIMQLYLKLAAGRTQTTENQKEPKNMQRSHHGDVVASRRLTQPTPSPLVTSSALHATQAASTSSRTPDTAPAPEPSPAAPPRPPPPPPPPPRSLPSSSVLRPPALPPRPPPGPPLSSYPRPPEAAKHSQDLDVPKAPNKKAKNFNRCIGDWRCRKCGFWNFRFMIECRRISRDRMLCAHEKGNNQDNRLEVQGEGLGVEKRVSGAKKLGDWLCECKWWNRMRFKNCGKCNGPKAHMIGQDWSEDLD